MTKFSYSVGYVTVTVTLYGEVSEERLAEEQKNAKRRAQQLVKVF